ncbi:MAG: ATP-binding protein, partial [Planctomycetota bacterium]
LEHPAHRVLYTAVPFGERVAVGFAIFDERFPVARPLAEEIRDEAGLAEVEIRYLEGVPIPRPTQRESRSFPVEGLVHAKFFAKTPEETGADASERSAFWLEIAAIYGLALLIAFLLPMRHPYGAPVAFLFAVSMMRSTQAIPEPWRVALLGLAALGFAATLPRTVHRAALGLLALLGALVLSSFVREIAEFGLTYGLFDSTHMWPGFAASLLLAGAAAAAWSVVHLTVRALRVPRPRGRAERVLLGALVSVVVLLPVLHLHTTRARTERDAQQTRKLLDLSPEDGAQLIQAANRTTDDQSGMHLTVGHRLAQGEDPSDFAFQLWSASGWDPRHPCAVEVFDGGLELVSRFDLDAPPADQLPAPPTALVPSEPNSAQRVRGRGAGSDIRFEEVRIALRDISDPDVIVGIARFLVPSRWDLMRSPMRRPIFGAPSDALVRAELDGEGRARFVSRGAPDEIAAATPRTRARLDDRGFATQAIEYRGVPARMLVVRGEMDADRVGGIVTAYSFWREVLFEAAHLLAVVAIGCLIVFAFRFRRIKWAFRHTIAFFLVVASLVPVLFIGAQQSNAIQQRYQQRTDTELRDDLDLATALLRRTGDDLDNDWCIGVSTDHKIDVNLYQNRTLVATSRPGVWDTGLLSRQLAAPAFESLVLRSEREYLGREPFAGPGDLRSGYRRIGENLILATPRLADRNELDRAQARETAQLGAIYLLAAALAVLLALPLSTVLMKPVRRLEEATRAVAAGKLDVELPAARGGGELADLVHSFERMTHDLREAQDLQARAERAAAWREMAQQIAHDVKNPLTPMKLTIQNLLALQEEDPEIFQEEFERGSHTILEQIDQLQRIAGNFSSFARMPQRNDQTVDVGELVRETAGLYEAAGTIFVELDGSPLVVHADRDELSRVLHNLLSNAREAGAETIRLEGHGENAHVQLDIRDDGRGIEPDMMERIFEPSFTTRTRGTGLGLPIVKRIVDDRRGTIAIDSEPGRGTCVTIVLPAAAPES